MVLFCVLNITGCRARERYLNAREAYDASRMDSGILIPILTVSRKTQVTLTARTPSLLLMMRLMIHTVISIRSAISSIRLSSKNTAKMRLR